MSSPAFIPYCGSPPVPGALAWNTDPVLITALIGVGAAYAIGCRRAPAPSRAQQGLFAAGFVIAAAALISPLCNLSVALFSARVMQHILLTLVAAPLIVLGRPALVFGRWLPPRKSRPGVSHAVSISGAVFAAAMWTWHLPGPYDATLENNAIYWAMHITTFGSALLLWHELLLRHTAQPGAALLVGFGTAMQMSFLGAILTLAPHAMFHVHFATTWPWGLSPLQDQELGGLIMWVPGGLLFTAYGLATFGSLLNGAGESAQRARSAR